MFSVVLALATLAVAGPAAAADNSNPFAPDYQHPYRHGAVPTLDTAAKMKAWRSAHPAPARTGVAAASANNLHYNGGVDGIGVTTGKERVYVVFWGTQWGTASTDSAGNTAFTGDPYGVAPRVQQFLKGVGTGGETWSGVMTQYCEGVPVNTQYCPLNSVHVAYPTGGAFAGVWYDNGAAAPAAATAAQISDEAVSAANHFGNTNAVLNRDAQYVVVSPTGTHPDNFNTTGSKFCAWHNYRGTPSAGDVAYTNLPYVLDKAGCGRNFVNAGSAGTLDGVSIVEGHEYAETVTDQNPRGGWTGPLDENGDACAWISGANQGAATNVTFATGTFAVQSTWSNAFNGGAGGCEVTRPVVGSDATTTGYVWNDRTSQAGCYQPSPSYSYNSRHAVNSVCRNGVGGYTVHFAGLGSAGGNAQVTAYGSTPANCKVGNWTRSGSEELVNVNCFSFAGAALDSYFTASFTTGFGAGNTFAFAWANSPSAASYVPNTTYQWNTRGGSATITRSGTGQYQVSFPDTSGAAAAGSVKVTAYGTGSGVCKVGNWGPNGAAEQVSVQCYNSAGAASDEYFSVAYFNGQNILGNNLMADAYAWANDPTSASYTPSASYQRSTTISNSGTVTISHDSTGSYVVSMPYQDQALDGGHVAATAYGNGTDRCQVGGWYSGSGWQTAQVYCFTNAGALVDSMFVVQFTARLQ